MGVTHRSGTVTITIDLFASPQHLRSIPDPPVSSFTPSPLPTPPPPHFCSSLSFPPLSSTFSPSSPPPLFLSLLPLSPPSFLSLCVSVSVCLCLCLALFSLYIFPFLSLLKSLSFYVSVPSFPSLSLSSSLSPPLPVSSVCSCGKLRYSTTLKSKETEHFPPTPGTIPQSKGEPNHSTKSVPSTITPKTNRTNAPRALQVRLPRSRTDATGPQSTITPKIKRTNAPKALQVRLPQRRAVPLHKEPLKYDYPKDEPNNCATGPQSTITPKTNRTTAPRALQV